MSLCRVCGIRQAAARRKWQRRSYSTAHDYEAAVVALNGLQSNFSIIDTLRTLGPTSNTPALPQMRRWARRIGYEPTDFDRLNPIHIAGTKGKGSTSSFISSILAHYLATQRSIHAERLPSVVGLYTSPHLRFVRERIKINNEPISEERFARCFWEVWDRLEASHEEAVLEGSGMAARPVYFHYLTLMALHCYMQEKVGTAVIECGIGGEYDTTNILSKPSVTGVTSLGIDHVPLLGHTIDEIAWHKAGIFKQDVPAFTVSQPKEALAVLHARAKERKTGLYVVPPHEAIDSIELGLQGHFQKLNASLAIAIAAFHLGRLGFTGLPDPYDPSSVLPPEFIQGLETTRLGGRCDMRIDPIAPGLTWFIDGGHTLESIDVAGQWFATKTAVPTSARPPKSTTPTRVLIFNQQKREKASSLVRKLHATLAAALQDARHPFTHVIFCPNTTYKAAGYKPELVSMNTNAHDVNTLRVQHELAQAWTDVDPDAHVNVVGTIEEAVGKAREVSRGQEHDVHVLATGSLHLVGGLIEVLEGGQRGSKI